MQRVLGVCTIVWINLLWVCNAVSGQTLTADEMRQLFGSTFVSLASFYGSQDKSDKYAVYMYVADNGRFHSIVTLSDGKTTERHGSVAIKDGKWCETFDWEEHCGTFERKGDLLYYQAPPMVRAAPLRVESGDPRKLADPITPAPASSAGAASPTQNSAATSTATTPQTNTQTGGKPAGSGQTATAGKDVEKVLDDQYSLILLGKDSATHATFWAATNNRDPCHVMGRNPWDGKDWIYLYTLITIPDQRSILDDGEAKRLISAAASLHRTRCSGRIMASWPVLILPERGFARDQGFLIPVFGPVLVEAGMSYDGHSIDHYANKALQEHEQVLARQKADDEEAATKRKGAEELEAFNAKAATTRDAFLSGVTLEPQAPNITDLSANPFAYKDKTLGMMANFEQMISATDAMLSIGHDPLVVSDVPAGALLHPGPIIVVGVVAGNMPVAVFGGSRYAPVLKFVKVYTCSDDRCRDFFGKK